MNSLRMDADQIEARLLNQLRMAHCHDTFTGNSAADLFGQIQQAAKRMVSEERTSENDLAEATNAFMVLLNEMDTERTRRGYVEFREDTVSWGLDKLCPGFWPFC
jgi:hypothetical protein